MKIAFKIPPTITDFSQKKLLIEVGDNDICFLIYDSNPFTVLGLYVFDFDKNIIATDYAAHLNNIIDNENILSAQYSAINVVYNFKNATLIPTTYFSNDTKEAIAALLFTNVHLQKIKVTTVAHLNEVKLLYAVPTVIENTLLQHFSTAIFTHANALQIKQPPTPHFLQCIVYHSTIKLILYKNEHLQIIQLFDYKNPTDVSYHLLNVCEQFDILPVHVHLQLGGFIEVDSYLYENIYKYFLTVQLATLPADVTVAADVATIPAQYFTHLITAAQCV
ncbi:DUF3822 family protein [Ferruginibacter yonginensis]|uniref:DUF3822 family protein n=1 Tax=Ferruginibacter yonginensis TaxID=1310416 RepID=A0ABV8QPN3_9BACT